MVREIELVAEFLARPEDDRGVPRSRWGPVLVFTGPRCSRKTRFLDDLAAVLDIPHARQDLEATVGLTTWQRLSALIFELSHQRGGFGRLGFPRFTTGQLVIVQQLDRQNRDLARKQVQLALENHRDVERLRQTLSTVATDLISQLPETQQLPGTLAAGRFMPDLVIRGLRATRWGRRVLLGGGLDWYRHQDRELGCDPVDELVDLNRWTNHPRDDAEARKAEDLLWSAFLADLRAEFRSRRFADRRTLNCAVLLDNIDNPTGRAFLDGLVRVRDQARDEEKDTKAPFADPLTVIATSRSVSLPWAPAGPPPPPPEEAGYQRYLEQRGENVVGRHWYPVRLRNLTHSEVGRMARSRGIRSSAVTGAVHRFTDGHPGSTDVLLGAFAAQSRDQPRLHHILDSDTAVEQDLLDRFLVTLSPEAREDLTTCAAAPDLLEAYELDERTELLTSDSSERADLFAAELWSPGESDGPRTLPKVLRRLLLRRLAARSAEHPASWSRVHEHLRGEGEVRSLHHALALGEVEPVARRLAELLADPGLPVAEWLDRLTAITAAPNRLDPAVPPLRHLQELSEWAEGEPSPVAPMARLVCARWLAHDPLVDTSRRHLLRAISSAYAEIAGKSGDMAALLAEAEKHSHAADQEH